MLWRTWGQDALMSPLGLFFQAARESWLSRDRYFKQGEKNESFTPEVHADKLCAS